LGKLRENVDLAWELSDCEPMAGRGRPRKVAPIEGATSTAAAVIADITRAATTKVVKAQAPVGMTADGWAKVLRGANLGIHPSRLWGLSGVGKKAFDDVLREEPWRAEAIEAASIQGENDMAEDVRLGVKTWESRAWILERTREGWRRETRTGAPLAVAFQVLGRFDSSEVMPTAQPVEVKALPQS
jgi:hypothetical protein